MSGVLLTLIGALHTALGAVVWASGRETLELSFWFTAFGVVAMGFGIAVIEVERARGHIPASILAAIVALTVFGLIVEPVSGFLTVLIPLALGIRGWLRNRRAAVAA
ncbi:DUF6463 family protein [Nocardia crassostreae]|uniref:DUF6463 family protein n=1 Tax=Nocardia crassostreae TaxID=53428 RepID=UPI000829C516|nr:DUF6463 family protein [Nocardia crassostreae]